MHVDQRFRAALEDYFSSFKSPFNASSICAAKQNAAFLFAIEKIVEEVKTAPMQERSIFLQTIIRRGQPEMIDLFRDIGIDLDEGYILGNYLGTAAEYRNLPVITSLLDAGASAARALPLLCLSGRLRVEEFNLIFSRLVDSLTDLNPKVIKEDDYPDAVLSVLKCNYDTSIRADCIQSLLKNGTFSSWGLYGSQQIFLPHSYVLNAILYNQTTALGIFIKYGALSETMNIEDIFRTEEEWFQAVGGYIWLTLAVELGKTACVKALVDNSRNSVELVKRQDAGGRCAISLAQSLAVGPHPRISHLYDLQWVEIRPKYEMEVSVSDDHAILEILTAALGSGRPSEAVDTASGECSSIQVPGTKRALLAPSWNKPGKKSFYVLLCFIGLYGVLICYSLLQFAFLRTTQQHTSRTLLPLCIVIPLSLVGSYFLLQAIESSYT